MLRDEGLEEGVDEGEGSLGGGAVNACGCACVCVCGCQCVWVCACVCWLVDCERGVVLFVVCVCGGDERWLSKGGRGRRGGSRHVTTAPTVGGAGTTTTDRLTRWALGREVDSFSERGAPVKRGGRGG